MELGVVLEIWWFFKLQVKIVVLQRLTKRRLWTVCMKGSDRDKSDGDAKLPDDEVTDLGIQEDRRSTRRRERPTSHRDLVVEYHT
jgi:hypothetical protein